MSKNSARAREQRIERRRAFMARLGTALREQRERRGEDRDAVALFLRIKPAYLAALEAGDLEAIGGQVYALGFLRSYAEHLGFDADDMVARTRAVLAEELTTRRLEPRRMAPRPVRPGLGMMAASLVSLLVAYAGWNAYTRGEPVLERAAQVPAELGRSVATLLAAVDDAPRAAVLVAARPADPPPSPTAVPHLAALNAPERPFRPTVQSAMREPDSAVEGISPAEPPAIGAAHAAAPPATPRIVLVAREESWIQVRSATRDYVHSVTLQPGDRFVTPDRDDLALWTGNAGGLEVLIDGASRGRLGERGRVIRSVSLSPEALAQRLHAIE